MTEHGASAATTTRDIDDHPANPAHPDQDTP